MPADVRDRPHVLHASAGGQPLQRRRYTVFSDNHLLSFF